MNKLVTTFAFAFALITTVSFANVTEDKAATSTIHTLPALPASLPVLETPAPQQVKPAKEQKYSPTQKAAIADLKLLSATK